MKRGDNHRTLNILVKCLTGAEAEVNPCSSVETRVTVSVEPKRAVLRPGESRRGDFNNLMRGGVFSEASITYC